MSGKPEYRNVHHGIFRVPARLVVKGEGWAMVRRKGAMPFIVSGPEWDAADLCTANGNSIIGGGNAN